MFRPSHAPPVARIGVILLVVLALLTLFAVVGLSFVLYADASALAARLFRESHQAPDRADQDPESLLAYFLGQLLYDVKDDASGVASSLRGHSLARSLYGYNDSDPTSNVTPFNGTGRLHAASPFPGIDDAFLVNYTYFPPDGLHDPERLGWRTDLAQPRGLFTGGANVPYTYPDLNNLFLAAVKADGTVLLPSYHRPWAGFGSLDPKNPYWYDKSQPGLKYQVLRPRPAEMPRFPLPEDAGGDVKNLVGAPGGNDSFWLDLGYPVQVAPDGRKYKPLFAALIMDLDSRLNVNVHGNIQGGRAHLSQKGLGPWEVNLQYVLGQPRPEDPEWPNLFLGSTIPPQTGRYAGSTADRINQPWLYNVFNPADGDRVFALSNLEALLRYGDTGSPSLTSELFRLCPANFADARIRRLVTTRSVDFDRPGASPSIYDPLQYPYQVTAGSDPIPAGPPIPFPALALRTQPVPADSEFSAPVPTIDWRALTAAIARVDLNRPLAPYPLTPLTPLASDFALATSQRQVLANEIYDCIRRATGVPRSGRTPGQPTPEELQVRRWLAQLAVNIVDFIDEDDIQTPFNFYTTSDAQGSPFNPAALSQSGTPPTDDPELPLYWVFGTEVPRAVVHEVLAEYEDRPFKPGTGVSTLVKVWVELHAPTQIPWAAQALPLPPGLPVPLRASGVAHAYAPYQLCLATGILARPGHDNVLGKPSGLRTATEDADFTQPGPPPAVPAAGFFVIGPPDNDAHNTLAQAGTMPANTPWLRSAKLRYEQAFVPDHPDERATGLTVLLRRLANPHLPLDPIPSIRDGNDEFQVNPSYNPYLTIDYVENIPLHNATSPLYASRGKRQPYASHPSQLADQIAPRLGQATHHTLGLPNNPLPLSGHSDWLVHLDRSLISPMELLHVSGYQPHQLTQRFIVGDDRDARQKFQHYVPWFDQTRRLYRVFEFLETHSLTPGITPSGPIPGKINLNTVWDPEILLALCDPRQPANGFTETHVRTIFSRLLALRSPQDVPGPTDRPFRSLATGYTLGDAQNPTGGGIEDTLLRSLGGAEQRLFEVPGAPHPYLQYELLTKIFNQVTTRSNVFAVWLTVGFFEVIDDTTRPVQLGAEVGRTENRHVRHRMFAIVDRSLMDRNPGPSERLNPRADPVVAHFSVID